MSQLGKFYIAVHDKAPPTFIQIIGWTKNSEKPDCKRTYFYVRKVPFNLEHTYLGGQWSFDQKIIDEYSREIKTPITKSCGSGTGILLNDGSISFNGQKCVPIQSLNLL